MVWCITGNLPYNIFCVSTYVISIYHIKGKPDLSASCCATTFYIKQAVARLGHCGEYVQDLVQLVACRIMGKVLMAMLPEDDLQAGPQHLLPAPREYDCLS